MDKLSTLDIVLAALAFLTPIILALLGFLLKDRLKRMDTDVAEIRATAHNALDRAVEIENNYNAKFTEVNKNIHCIEQGLQKSIDDSKSTTISRLYHMEKEITTRLHAIQIFILTGKIEALSEEPKTPESNHGL